MHKITVDNQILFARDGETLSSVLMRYGLAFSHPCGGRGVCKKCILLVDGKEQLSCRYVVNSDITLTLPLAQKTVKNDGENAKTTGDVCFAFDLGTTTLALAVVQKSDGKIAKVISRQNPQSLYGADVMTRIAYGAKSQENATALHKIIISAISEMINESGVTANELFVSGNTTMLHFLFGIDCSSIGVYPYTPTFLRSKTVSANELGVIGVKTVTSLDNISSFVGADLTAGALLLPPPNDGAKYNILVDLGTNAEILLYNENTLVCTAAAAGPCFEGANISCGTSYTEGAIHAFSIDEKGNKIVKTVGDVPRGLCGTGLVDVIASLVKAEIIDETGYMENDYEIAEGVTLTGEDVRQFQLAKSAISSAIVSLMESANVPPSQVESLFVSGGFATAINVENALFVGLLPKCFKGKIYAVGNSCLLGTVKFATANQPVPDFIKKGKYLDLSQNATFTRLFMENMYFGEEND